MKKIICAALMGLMIGVGALGFVTEKALAVEPSTTGGQATSSAASTGSSGGCEHSILGLRPWYSGLPMGDNCAVQSPSESEMTSFIWKIVLNVLSDVFVIAGYLAIGFVIYGGVQYMMSAGDPGKVERGKKMLVSAATGLIIALLATVIVNIIISVLAGAAA